MSNSIVKRKSEEYANEMLRLANPELALSHYSRRRKMGIQMFCGSDLEDAYLRGYEDAGKWKSADGDELPEIDREVIALTTRGKVVFAHRPVESYVGKDIFTGKKTIRRPIRYGKGGWNADDILWWLDVEIPKID